MLETNLSVGHVVHEVSGTICTHAANLHQRSTRPDPSRPL
jgi:hypothetical protein